MRRATIPPPIVKKTTNDASLRSCLIGNNNSLLPASDDNKHASVSFAPLPPTPSYVKKRSTSSSTTLSTTEQLKLRTKGFRPDYSLGDIARSPSHMVHHSIPEQSYESVNSLQIHDFAWVKRTNGSYSYAILAFRSLEPPSNPKSKSEHDEEILDEYLGFVMCNEGSIKYLKKCMWSEYVRPVSMVGMDPILSPSGREEGDQTGVKQQEHQMAIQTKIGKDANKKEWAPPSIISYIRKSPGEQWSSMSVD